MRIDFRVIPLILALMSISLLIISSYSVPHVGEAADEPFFTARTLAQLKWFVIGWGVFFLAASFDYNRLREWAWFLYVFALIALIGLFFTSSIQRVHRWYRLPLVNISLQPSELAKLIVVITLSWFLERASSRPHSLSRAFFGGLIVLIPFILILKQPDLGSALVLYPIALVMFYFGNVHPKVVQLMGWSALLALTFILSIFSQIVPIEKVRSFTSLFLKEYQMDRLDPTTHHNRASCTAISMGGVTGLGWRGSEFTARGWLPTPDTDSVFPSFGEEFGLVGLVALLALFYSLIFFSFQVTAVAKDEFGRLLSAGITVYLAMHIMINIGMMCGLLPITGVPLVLISYGGSSILSTMAALGLLQSIYSRRFMF
ncbi:MAG: hypothetical protein K0S07_999 [Chlamydiales bacterium]|jgi:rod shape determining protein RodA|nr:hypothetical protein [Chlamydiales bacterium]